jgi:S1-C subfamily serine protease
MTQRIGIRNKSWGLLSLLAALVFSQPGLTDPESGEKVYQKTLRGTVWILARHGERLASGTGSLIDKTHRWVITNYHVVGEEKRVWVLFAAFPNGKLVVDRDYYRQVLREGKSISGRVIDRDSKHDLALIQLDSVPDGAQYISRASEGASPGQRVHSVGNPGRSGALWVYTSGTVRTQAYLKRWRVHEGDNVTTIEARVIETQSPTNQGDSGGPLVNDHGDLVAVTQGYASDAQLLSLFIDISEVNAFVNRNNRQAKLPPPARRSSEEQASRVPMDKPIKSAADSDKVERRAATNLEFAKTLAEEGKVESAKKRYEQIMADFPNTKAAAEAKLLLDKLDK